MLAPAVRPQVAGCWPGLPAPSPHHATHRLIRPAARLVVQPVALLKQVQVAGAQEHVSVRDQLLLHCLSSTPGTSEGDRAGDVSYKGMGPAGPVCLPLLSCALASCVLRSSAWRGLLLALVAISSIPVIAIRSTQHVKGSREALCGPNRPLLSSSARWVFPDAFRPPHAVAPEAGAQLIEGPAGAPKKASQGSLRPAAVRKDQCGGALRCRGPAHRSPRRLWAGCPTQRRPGRPARPTVQRQRPARRGAAG